MQIYPNKLAQHLSTTLLPVYLISGEEPLQIQECCDAIRQAARQQGCEERIVHHADGGSFNWDDFSADSNALSLFASRRLIEVRLGKQKTGKDGSAALVEYCERCEPDTDVLLITTDKLDKSTLNSRWVKQIDGIGGVLRVWPVEPTQLPHWIDQRLRQAGLSIESDALKLLSDRVEGNLLAAAQDIEKLKLYAGENSAINLQTVQEAVADSARFNVYDLADSLLSGNAEHCIRMLRGVRDEGTDAAAVHWVFRKEILLLVDLNTAINEGANPAQAMQRFGVWKNRQQVVGNAVKRLSVKRLERATSQLADADQAFKGAKHDDPWRIFEQIAVNLKSHS